MSLCLAHMPFCWFCHEVAHLIYDEAQLSQTTLMQNPFHLNQTDNFEYNSNLKIDFEAKCKWAGAWQNNRNCLCTHWRLQSAWKRPRGRAVSAFDFGPQGRIPLEARFFPNLNSASLHRAFHVHPSIVLIWLKCCWKGRKTLTHPSMGTCPVWLASLPCT